MTGTWAKSAALLLALVPVAFAHGGPSTVTLLSNTEVFGDVILLSNLLPKDAPPLVKQAAESISLGETPQLGATRVIPAAAVLRSLENAKMSPSEFGIPELISVRRAGRFISREEVLAAIQPDAAVGPQNLQPRFQLEDIRVDPAVRIAIANPRLLVAARYVDHRTGCTWFLLRALADPRVLPFYASACPAAVFPDPVSSAENRVHQFAVPGLSAASLKPVLVEPGQQARLLVQSPDSKMVLLVHPLQRGHLGETVRVRLDGSAKILQGRVAGNAYLSSSY